MTVLFCFVVLLYLVFFFYLVSCSTLILNSKSMFMYKCMSSMDNYCHLQCPFFHLVLFKLNPLAPTSHKYAAPLYWTFCCVAAYLHTLHTSRLTERPGPHSNDRDPECPLLLFILIFLY